MANITEQQQQILQLLQQLASSRDVSSAAAAMEALLPRVSLTSTAKHMKSWNSLMILRRCLMQMSSFGASSSHL
jgi:hypothetical protein